MCVRLAVCVLSDLFYNANDNTHMHNTPTPNTVADMDTDTQIHTHTISLISYLRLVWHFVIEIQLQPTFQRCTHYAYAALGT